MKLLSRLSNHDPILTLVWVLISLIGLVNVFATTFYPQKAISGDFVQQIIFILIGLVGMYIPISLLSPSVLQQFKLQIIISGFVILILLVTLLTGDSSGSPARWIRVGQLSIQPSEFAKLSIILLTAAAVRVTPQVRLVKILPVFERVLPSKVLTFLSSETTIRLGIATPIVIATVGLILIQPSLGNALLSLAIWALIITTLLPSPTHVFSYGLILIVGLNVGLKFIDPLGYSSGQLATIGLMIIALLTTLGMTLSFKLNNIVVLTVLGLGLFVGFSSGFVWENVLTEYQQDRIVTFANPTADPQGSGWQVAQARIAIASSQIFGKGFLQGTQTNSGLLPYAYTDFAYTAFLEQFGIIGSLVLLGLYLTLIIRVIQIGEGSQDNFSRVVCFGIAIMFILNILVNVGMNLGVLPVTGVPLPLVSYGGSAVLVNLIGLGLVQMVKSNNKSDMKVEIISELA